MALEAVQGMAGVGLELVGVLTPVLTTPAAATDAKSILSGSSFLGKKLEKGPLKGEYSPTAGCEEATDRSLANALLLVTMGSGMASTRVDAVEAGRCVLIVGPLPDAPPTTDVLEGL